MNGHGRSVLSVQDHAAEGANAKEYHSSEVHRSIHALWCTPHREGTRRVLELLLQRLHMVGVHVRIAQHMHELARRQAAHIREHAPADDATCMNCFCDCIHDLCP